MNFLEKILNGFYIFGYRMTRGICIVISLLLMTSCVEEVLSETESKNPNDIEIEGDVLGFYIELDKSLATSTRDGNLPVYNSEIEGKDDWIDMQDKFRIFFFSENGDFLFGANDRIVGSVENFSGSTSKDYWYVRIPMTMIVDRNNKEYDISKIKRYIKTHKFKVAVLANWPNAGDKVNPSDFDDSEDNFGKVNESSLLKGEPLWGWENSVLNEKADPKKIMNINDLHHIYDDEYYAHNTTSDRPTRYEVYGAFMDNYNGKPAMGEPTDWVKMRDISEANAWKYTKSGVPEEKFDSKETANAWIRAYWDPSIGVNENKKIYRHYQHLWFLWNFNAIYTTGRASNQASTVLQAFAGNFGWDDGYNFVKDTEISGVASSSTTTINKWGKEWWERNGSELYSWMKDNASYLRTKSLARGSADNAAFLTFVESPSTDPCKVVSVTIGGNTRYGIKLAAMDNQGVGADGKTTIARTNDTSQGFFKFKARTSGTLRIKWGSADKDNLVQLVVQKGGTRNKTYEIAAGNTGKWYDINGTTTNDAYCDISIGGESEDMYIWSPTGNVIIYGIEYIRGKYLFDTDREGVAPNDEQGIPMYGVQEFDPIPDWEYGTTYNLEYNVSLIRSLAKVIVHIPVSFGKPKHMYMRCMNRMARCEPMDVETNTVDLWNESAHDNTHCEWFNIQHYGPTYQDGNENKDKTDLEPYKKFLKWFYGSWDNTKWPKHTETSRTYINDENEEDYGLWRQNTVEFWRPQVTDTPNPSGMNSIKYPSYNKNTGVTSETERTDTYPHLFNPYINRSDFCSFLYAGSDGVNHTYILYVPEKYIDDPNYPGVINSTPKVPHVEYRFGEDESIDSAKKTQDQPSAIAGENYNTEFNLDDGSCQRIYFTNYGFDPLFNMTSENSAIRDYFGEGYDTYEKSKGHLSYHWPIMRNHIYEFYVSGSGPENPEIVVKVTDWAHKKVVVDW